MAHALLAVFAGLAHRDRTGEDVYVDLAQTETGAALMAPLYLEHLAGGGDRVPHPHEVPGSLLAEVFACRGHDEWLAVELEDQDDWDAACGLLGISEPSMEGMRTALAGWCRDKGPHQAMFLAQRAGLAAGAVQDAEDLYLDAQHRSRGFIVEIDHPDLGPLEYPAPVYRFDRTPVAVRRPSPRVGEHTADVLREWLATAPGADGPG